jgi:hypothetical protein
MAADLSPELFVDTGNISIKSGNMDSRAHMQHHVLLPVNTRINSLVIQQGHRVQKAFRLKHGVMWRGSTSWSRAQSTSYFVVQGAVDILRSHGPYRQSGDHLKDIIRSIICVYIIYYGKISALCLA